jgi:DNA-binding NarL/FixJ family response regulator
MSTFIIVDDHPSMRTGLKSILEEEGDFTCVGEAETIPEAARLIHDRGPDLAFVDISLGEESGFDIFSYLDEYARKPSVIFISMFFKANYVVKAVTLGAWGYLAKDSPSGEIIRAARTVREGHHFFDAFAADALAEWLRTVPNAGEMVVNNEYNCLSEREKEIFRLLAQGFGTTEIGKNLFISPKTVQNYRNTILRRLKLDSMFELKAFAEEMGIL